ncbi:MAG: hypothetical protein GY822_09750 [Deltaproteobacteria bacterium]|nr:hypothetical protein [Deltaproteobacteria bacterium]
MSEALMRSMLTFLWIFVAVSSSFAGELRAADTPQDEASKDKTPEDELPDEFSAEDKSFSDDEELGDPAEFLPPPLHDDEIEPKQKRRKKRRRERQRPDEDSKRYSVDDDDEVFDGSKSRANDMDFSAGLRAGRDAALEEDLVLMNVLAFGFGFMMPAIVTLPMIAAFLVVPSLHPINPPFIPGKSSAYRKGFSRGYKEDLFDRQNLAVGGWALGGFGAFVLAWTGLGVLYVGLVFVVILLPTLGRLATPQAPGLGFSGGTAGGLVPNLNVLSTWGTFAAGE